MSLVTLNGLDVIDQKLAELASMIDEPRALDVMQSAADGLAGKIKNAAPQGPTGNLKQGVVAHKFKKQRRGNPAAFVGIDYRYAPHAHLVEYGTRNPREVKTKKVLSDGTVFYGKSVEPMPAHPFFRPTVDNSKDSIRQDISDGLRKIILDIAR